MSAMLVHEVDCSAPDCSYGVYARAGFHATAHKLHTEFGMVAAIASVLHSAGWIARIVQYNTSAFLWDTQVFFTLCIDSLSTYEVSTKQKANHMR